MNLKRYAFLPPVAACMAASLLACPPCPVAPAVGVDASDGVDVDSPAARASDCVQGCKNLATLGCREGRDADCVPVCQRIKQDRLTTTCWTVAKNVADARACGVRCDP